MERPADGIWVWTKYYTEKESWHHADKAERIPKSDGRPKALQCYFTTYGLSWTAVVSAPRRVTIVPK